MSRRMQGWLFNTLLFGLVPFLVSLLMFGGRIPPGQFLRRPELPFLVIVLSAGIIRDAAGFRGLGAERPWMHGSGIALVIAGTVLYFLGRLPEIGIAAPIATIATATLIVTVVTLIVSVIVQHTLAMIEGGS